MSPTKARLPEELERPRFQHAEFDVTGTDGVLLAADAGRVIHIFQFWLWNVSEQDLDIRDDGKTLSGYITTFPAKSAMFLPFTGGPHWELQPSNSLRIRTNLGTRITGFISYRTYRS